jgi:hypothetical protein
MRGFTKPSIALYKTQIPVSPGYNWVASVVVTGDLNPLFQDDKGTSTSIIHMLYEPGLPQERKVPCSYSYSTAIAFTTKICIYT